MRILSVLLVLFGIGILHGCSAEAQDSPSHEFTPKHGGQPVELAAHGPILEVVHGKDAGTLKIFVFGPHQEVLTLEQAPTCTIGKDGTPITGKGAGTEWQFTSDQLKGHPHDVMLGVTIDGKPYSAGWHPPH